MADVQAIKAKIQEMKKRKSGEAHRSSAVFPLNSFIYISPLIRLKYILINCS